MRQKAKLGKIRTQVKHKEKAITTAVQTPKLNKFREETMITPSSLQPISAKKLRGCITSNGTSTEYLSIEKNPKTASHNKKELVFDRLYNRSKKTHDHSVNNRKIGCPPAKRNATSSKHRKEIISSPQLHKPNIRISQQSVPSPCHSNNQSTFERLYEQKKPYLSVAALANSTSINSFSQHSNQKSSRTKEPPRSPNIRASQRTVPSPTYNKGESAFDRLYKQSFVIAAKKKERMLQLDQKCLTFRPSLNHNIKKSQKKPYLNGMHQSSLPKPKTLIDFLFHPTSLAKTKYYDSSNLTPSDDISLPVISNDDPSHIVRPNYGFKNNDGARDFTTLDFESDSDSVSALLAKGGYIETNFERIESPQKDSGSEYSHCVIDEVDFTCGKISVSSDVSLDSL